jgi:hypothetical protein
VDDRRRSEKCECLKNVVNGNKRQNFDTNEEENVFSLSFERD